MPVRPRLWVLISLIRKYQALLFIILLHKFGVVVRQIMKNKKQIFDHAELALLKEGLNWSYKERFEMATRLFKIQQTMAKPQYLINLLLTNKFLGYF